MVINYKYSAPFDISLMTSLEKEMKGMLYT